MFFSTLKGIKVPDEYSSNISRRVDLKGNKIFGLKSHDYHILLHQFLPLAVKHAMHVSKSGFDFLSHGDDISCIFFHFTSPSDRQPCSRNKNGWAGAFSLDVYHREIVILLDSRLIHYMIK